MYNQMFKTISYQNKRTFGLLVWTEIVKRTRRVKNIPGEFSFPTGWAISHQSLIKKMSHSQILLRYFQSWGPLLSDNLCLCQVNIKLEKTMFSYVNIFLFPNWMSYSYLPKVNYIITLLPFLQSKRRGGKRRRERKGEFHDAN